MFYLAEEGLNIHLLNSVDPKQTAWMSRLKWVYTASKWDKGSFLINWLKFFSLIYIEKVVATTGFHVSSLNDTEI